MIEIRCNGKVVQGFTSVSITRSMDSIAATYSMGVFSGTESRESAWLPIFPGDEVEIAIDGDVVVKGYNVETTPSFNNSGIGCNVSGSEKTCDLVDCPSKTINFENKKVDEIVRIICADFDLRFAGANGVDVGSPLKKFAADIGTTAFNVMVNACRERNVYPSSDGLGNVCLIGSSHEDAEVSLVQGVNVVSASGRFSVSNRYSKYTIYSSKDANGKTYASIYDDEMTRNREWVMLDERFATKENCEARALWEAKHRQAMGNALNVIVNGWRQKDGGHLWKPGLYVVADIPCILGSETRSYVVNKVNYTFGSNGSQTSLELVDEDCYLPMPQLLKSQKKLKAQKDTWASVRKQTGSKLQGKKQK